jgi:hypothetical protein
MSFVAVAVGTASLGAIQTGAGLIGKAKANRLERENVRPTYSTPTEILANQKIAENRANSGLPSEQYLKQKRDIDRNARRAIETATSRRSALSVVGATQQAADDATLDLNSADARQRLANEKNLQQQNQVLAGYRDKEFEWNKKGLYVEKANAIRALKGAANANINSGINTIVGAGTTFASLKAGKTPSAAEDVAPQMEWVDAEGLTGTPLAGLKRLGTKQKK